MPKDWWKLYFNQLRSSDPELCRKVKIFVPGIFCHIIVELCFEKLAKWTIGRRFSSVNCGSR